MPCQGTLEKLVREAGLQGPALLVPVTLCSITNMLTSRSQAGGRDLHMWPRCFCTSVWLGKNHFLTSDRRPRCESGVAWSHFVLALAAGQGAPLAHGRRAAISTCIHGEKTLVFHVTVENISYRASQRPQFYLACL